MKEIETVGQFKRWLSGASPLKPAAVQAVDASRFDREIQQREFTGSIFLGCELSEQATNRIVATGGIVFPQLDDFLFPVHRSRLYEPEELFSDFDPEDENSFQNTLDHRVYLQYKSHGGAQTESIRVTLARRLHDHSITDALHDAIKGEKVVAIMGGHSMERGDPYFAKIAHLSRLLTQDGFLMVSGGGPGAMEATHVGAYFASRKEFELDAALSMMSKRPEGAEPGREYADHDWLHRAWRVRLVFPLSASDKKKCRSIGIPTWLYGQEPPTPFATHIAKYFANSVREDGLLQIANHGLVFSPGSAGTIQEIFQDAAQNHYHTTGGCAPMILFGEQYWKETKPVWPLMKSLSRGQPYGELLAITDSAAEIRRRLASFRPELYGKPS
ncbi:MAG: hypothetical protein AAGG44_07785 [Planctomycetota bacterium]